MSNFARAFVIAFAAVQASLLFVDASVYIREGWTDAFWDPFLVKATVINLLITVLIAIAPWNPPAPPTEGPTQ